MSLNVVRRLATGWCSVNRLSIRRSLGRVCERNLSGSSGLKDTERRKEPFDVSMLQFLVCPLSKKHLRYEETTNELINEELGIAYPIIDGIPNMIPQDARLINKTEEAKNPTQA